MPTVPGTQVLSGAGTVILLPDGTSIPWTSVVSYSLSGTVITFKINGLADMTPDFLLAQTAGLAMKALQSIPNNPSSFYILTQLFPSFAALNLSAVSDAAAGGTAIDISGVGFQDGCMVNWNGSLTPVTFTDSTKITITTPAGVLNQIFFPIVINPDGNRSTTLDSFKYT